MLKAGDAAGFYSKLKRPTTKRKARVTKTTSAKNTSLSLPGNYASVRVTASKQTKFSASEMQQQLSDLCIDIYLNGGVERFIPLPPFVLVYVLPKDMVSDGGIIIPDQKQNKPVHEGIVLETWRPYKEEVVLTRRHSDSTYTEYIGEIQRICPVNVGDRVAYPYYEGVQHKYLGDNFVLVRHAADQIKFPYCQILGTIDYEGDRKIANKIRILVRKFYSITTSGANVSRGANPLECAK